MKKKYIFLTLIVTAFMPLYLHAQVAANSETFRQEGIASWYGREFDGRLTANGEVFDSSQLTAAHPTLPFGTMVVVTNRHNNRTVTVRINDRGPFVAARIIDVSRAAAEHLDMIITGTAPVLVESVDRIVVSSPTQPQVQPVNPQVSQVTGVQLQQVNPQVNQPQTQIFIPAQTVQVQTIPAQPVVPAQQTFVQPSVPAQTVPAQPVAPVQQTFTQPSVPASPEPVQSTFVQPAPVTHTGVVQETAPVFTQQAPIPVPPRPVRLMPADVIISNHNTYRLQVGSFRVARNAVEAFDRLRNAGLNPAYERHTENDIEHFRVVIAGVRGSDVASVVERIGAAGFRDAVIRLEN